MKYDHFISRTGNILTFFSDGSSNMGNPLTSRTGQTPTVELYKEKKRRKIRNTQKYSFFSKCTLRQGVVRVFVSFRVLVFVRAIL